jgi:hypothetical protein
MSKRLDVLEIFISLKVTRQNLLKKLYLGSKQDAEWSKMVWNRSILLTIPDFRFHLKDGWNLTKNNQVLVGLKKLSSFWTVLVGKIDWNLTKKFEVACFLAQNYWKLSKCFQVLDEFSCYSESDLVSKSRKLFQVHEFVQVSTGTVFRTFQQF